jgi:hypothetical protein
VHYGGASERARAAKMARLLAAKVTLINRHWPLALRPVGVLLLMLWPATRALTYTLAARATGLDRHRQMAATWREVWAARDDWRRGYPEGAPAGTTAPAAPAALAPLKAVI